MKPQIVKQKDWVYTLIKINEEYILIVDFCNQITDYWISYKLNLSDITDEYLDFLTQRIRENPEKFKDFEVETPKLQ